MQTKLTLDTPGDSHEQEADRIAAEVVGGPVQTVAGGATARINSLSGLPTGPARNVPASVSRTLRSAGRALEPGLREDMEQRLGHNFSQVQVHTGAAAEQSAQELAANAYTSGNKIVFGAGRFAPGTREGRRLIAHELTHVVQQKAAGGGSGRARGVARIQRDTAPTPLIPIGPFAPAADIFLSRHFILVGKKWDIEGAAKGLDDHLKQNRQGYAFVRAVFDAFPSRLEDNLAAALVERLPTTRLNTMALTAEGRALLDVLYEAMITGDVTDFQRRQSERLLEAKKARTSQAKFLETLDRRMIFPIRNIGLKLATATFQAKRLPNGNVKVRYTSRGVTEDDMFKDDLKTLPPWGQLREGIELDPEEMVAVRLHDEGGILVDLPALGLIDYGNQIQNTTLSVASTAFFLGLTLGAGALGGGAVRALQVRVAAGEASKASLWAMRSVLWADRIAWGIPAGAMVINSHRDWILENFPRAGPVLLDAIDTANRVAGYYGWGRLGIGTIRYLGAKMRGAVEPWRQARTEAAKRSEFSAKEQTRIKAIEDEADTLAAELHYAEEKAAGAAAGDAQAPATASPPAAPKAGNTINASPAPAPAPPRAGDTIKASPPPSSTPYQPPRGPALVTDADVVAASARRPGSVKPQTPAIHQRRWEELGGDRWRKAPIAYRNPNGDILLRNDSWLLAPAPTKNAVAAPGPAPRSGPRVVLTKIPYRVKPGQANPAAPAQPTTDPLAQTAAAPDPMAQTPAAPAPSPAPSRSNIPNTPVAPDAPTGAPANNSQPPQAPHARPAQPVRTVPDPPQPLSAEGVERVRRAGLQPAKRGRGNAVNFSGSAELHQQAWQRFFGRGDAPPAFLYDGQAYLDPSRWPPKP